MINYTMLGTASCRNSSLTVTPGIVSILECSSAHECACVVFLTSGEFIAQFKFTVLLMPNGPLR